MVAADPAAPPELPAPSLFLSYSSADREAARRLRDATTAVAGFTPPAEQP